MFSWILKEQKIISDEIFWPENFDCPRKQKNDFHDNVLAVFFHQILNVPKSERVNFKNTEIQEIAKNTPFLNGSLFARYLGDESIHIPENLYRNRDAENRAKDPGLFDILEKYSWTIAEHRADESDQSLDPDLLGNILERFISIVENTAGQRQNRQPAGTYYTPKDVVQEMIFRALMAHAKAIDDKNLDLELVQKILREEEIDRQTRVSGKAALKKFRNRLAEVKVVDLAVGSAIFLVEMIHALQQAIYQIDELLGETPNRQKIFHSILESQIYGVDLQPMAVMIARLRIFLSYLDSCGSDQDQKPLPNLEARIICANTLKTSLKTESSPTLDKYLLAEELRNLDDIYIEWHNTHSEARKQYLREREKEIKATIDRDAFSKDNVCLLDQPQEASNGDLRNLWPGIFATENPGFDIVIGNPPYLDTSNVKTVDKNDLKKQGFQNLNRVEFLFMELAEGLSKGNKSVVSQIVPISISFRKDFKIGRQKFQKSYTRIDLSHFDNRPTTIFPGNPYLENSESRVRALIFTATKENFKKSEIYTSILQRWYKEERKECLKKQPENLIAKDLLDRSNLSCQWPRIPSKNIADVFQKSMQGGVPVMELANDRHLEDRETILCYPHAAYHYISVTPQGSLRKVRPDKTLKILSYKNAQVIFLALNTRVFYLWWLAWNDGFDITSGPVQAFPIPTAWIKNQTDHFHALRLARELEGFIPDLKKEISVQGGTSETINFFDSPTADSIITKADRLYFSAIGIPENRHSNLIMEMNLLRFNSNWK